MSDIQTGTMRVRCERGHFVSNVIGHLRRIPIGATLTGVTGDCSVCGNQVPVVQTFEGEVFGWSWEDVFGEWDGES